MRSKDIRELFFNFFKQKQHRIVSSAPMVLKNDPTLMFTNAGMNQFKDFFLGNKEPVNKRVANTQKCLRVSGKHNDLEEVGHDTYHHTMFEMLGNWSFGDYFKKEAASWAWEFLTEVCHIDKDMLYVTVFGGDEAENLESDNEALEVWKNIVSEDRIIFGSKKDNFWEMGDQGPCGPCSEIHIDIRDAKEKQAVDGKSLVNKDHPLVIEVWNLVFIEFNRMADGRLEKLKARHVDTGMGFERLCMVLQGVKSNYDTDCFMPLINKIAQIASLKYGRDNKQDVAMRVVADHVRAVTFAIADGQLPSNVKAGYVIRRILRRAIRYAYVFLGIKQPFIFLLVDTLTEQLGEVFPEIIAQKDFIKTIIEQEEKSFLKTLSLGLAKYDNYVSKNHNNSQKVIEGQFAFELYDTYGFPVDLTALMAKEDGWKVDMAGFNSCMKAQKDRSKKAANIEISDWVELGPQKETEFVGYEHTVANINILRFRKLTAKNDESYQLVFDTTPFYAESGGQVGDTGYIESEKEKILIVDTIKENDMFIHCSKELPRDLKRTFMAYVDVDKRKDIAAHHSATHLLHAALKKVLGPHVEQKGSLVMHNRLRFDFSHFERMTVDEIKQVESLVNQKIRDNIAVSDMRDLSYKEAMKMGAVALFGEKYEDNVRVIAFDKNYSAELCGGTHVQATGEIAIFKIVSETAIAAGTRRIEALTGSYALAYLNAFEETVGVLSEMFNRSKDVKKSVEALIEENTSLKKEIESFKNKEVNRLKEDLLETKEHINGVDFVAKQVPLDMASVKNLAFALKAEHDNLILLLGTVKDNKINLSLLIGDALVASGKLNAAAIIKEIAKEIKGGGGGQAFFATAGGVYLDGFNRAKAKALEIIKKA